MSGTCLCLCLVHAPVGQSWPGLRKTGGRGWEETVGEQLRGWRRKSKELGMSGWGKRTAGMEMREAGKECRNEAGLTSANIKARVSGPDKPCGRKRLCLCFFKKKKERPVVDRVMRLTCLKFRVMYIQTENTIVCKLVIQIKF